MNVHPASLKESPEVTFKNNRSGRSTAKQLQLNTDIVPSLLQKGGTRKAATIVPQSSSNSVGIGCDYWDAWDLAGLQISGPATAKMATLPR